MAMERRKLNRRNFSYYMRVMDETTGELVGHLADISTGGFKLDCRQPVPLNRDFALRVDLTSEVANKTHMVFAARSKWCQPDRYDPSAYNVGFQIINMSASDLEVFARMFEKYGSTNKNSNLDYLWK